MAKKIRFFYWILVGFIKKHPRALFVSIFLGTIGTLLSPKFIGILPKPLTTEKIGIVGQPTLAELPLFIQNQISIGLTSIDISGKAQPALSDKYTIENNGKRYIFYLQEGLYWHDGKAFNVEDVKYNFQNVSTSFISPNSIVFELQEPFAPFPTLVSQPLFRQLRSSIFPGKSTLIGIGPTKVKKIIRNGHIIKEIILQSQQKKIHYRFYHNQEAAIIAFKLGEIDKILDLSSPGELVNWPNTKISEVLHQDRYVGLFYNTKDAYLSSKGLRQALTYAIPNKPSGERRALSPLNPNSWAFNPQVKPYEFSLEDSQRLLEAEKEENLNFHPTFELTTTLPYLTTAEQIKEQWSTLGIPTTIKVATFLPESFQALLIGQEIPPDPDQYSLWHSTQSTNLTHYNSPKIDKLLEDGRQTIDQKERIQIYQDFQRFLVEDSPAAFLFHLTTYTIERS